MTKIAEIHKIDAQHVAESLSAACKKLDGGNVETVLDFTAVPRVDPSALREMETLATLAEESGTKVCLLHVNVEIYKVLKLAKLAERFNFRT
jgi:anti-anti-sigma regulatory factor